MLTHVFHLGVLPVGKELVNHADRLCDKRILVDVKDELLLIFLRWEEALYQLEDVTVKKLPSQADGGTGAHAQYLQEILNGSNRHYLLGRLLLSGAGLPQGVLVHTIVLQ